MRKRDHERAQRRRSDTAAVNGPLVRRRIRELGFTQAEFAAENDIPQRTLERALAGGRILKVLLVRIAAALSLPYADVVAGDPRTSRVAPRASFAPPGTENGSGSRARNRRLIRSANQLRSEFQRATEGRKPPLAADDFGAATPLIDAMCALDANNGHAHYYAGEVKRWIGRREESHHHFFRYLDFYQQVFAPIQETDAGLEHCYRTAHGYCRERTAWIHHLLALDLWRQGRAKRDRGILAHALNHADAALSYFPGGFIQYTSTTTVREAIGLAIAKIEEARAAEPPAHPPAAPLPGR
jgi:transcriptional regulator with XRE-family HTH domain